MVDALIFSWGQGGHCHLTLRLLEVLLGEASGTPMPAALMMLWGRSGTSEVWESSHGGTLGWPVPGGTGLLEPVGMAWWWEPWEDSNPGSGAWLISAMGVSGSPCL